MKPRLSTAVLPFCLILSSINTPPFAGGRDTIVPDSQGYSASTPTPLVRISSIVRAEDNFSGGTLQMTIQFPQKPASGIRLSIQVKDGNLVAASRQLTTADSLVTCQLIIPRPKLWSAEIPFLYSVEIRYEDNSHTQVKNTGAIIRCNTGFRATANREGNLVMNDHVLLLKGFAYRTSRNQQDQISREALLQEIRILKQCNINAVRAPRYRGMNDWYDLCDQYGLYILEDADTGFYEKGPIDTAGMAARLAEHPSVIATSAAQNRWNFPVFDHASDLLLADKSLSPAGIALKTNYRPVEAQVVKSLPAVGRTPVAAIKSSPANAGISIRINNGYSFRSLSNVTLHWDAQVNGVVKQSGNLSELPTGPGKSTQYHLPINAAPGQDLYLNIRFLQKKADPLLPAGFVIARQQIPLLQQYNRDLGVKPDGALSFKDEENLFTINSSLILIQFDKQTGWLKHYEVSGTTLLSDTMGIRCNFWQSPSQADTAGSSANIAKTDPITSQDLATWKRAARTARLQLFSTSTSSDIVIIKADYELAAANANLHVRYTINAKGEIEVQQSLETDSTKKGSSLPYYGMQMILPVGFDSVSWYGTRMNERCAACYTVDQAKETRDGGETGIFSSAIQASSQNLDAVRWYSISNAQGKGILLMADSSLLSVNTFKFAGKDPRLMALDQGGMTLDQKATADTIKTIGEEPTEQPPVSGTMLEMDQTAMCLPYANYQFAYKMVPLPAKP